MAKAKKWKWEEVKKDAGYWDMPDPVIYYLENRWKNNKFKTFLDIGCGKGRHSLFMASSGFKVQAFDIIESNVSTLEKKATKLHYEISLKTCDMHNMPYPDNSVDCMLALSSINHTDTKGFKKIMKEVLRVLKPGGETYLTLGSKDSDQFTREDSIAVDANTRARVEEGFSQKMPHFFVDDEDCRSLFNDFIFVDLKYIKRITEYGSFNPHYHLLLKKPKV